MEEIQKLLLNNFDILTSSEEEKKSGRGRASNNSGSLYGIKKLRELILELAVRGKLVPQNPDDEPVSELLKRIQVEKSKLIRDGKIKKKKPLAPIADNEKMFELPPGWEWVRLGNTGIIFNGNSINENEKLEKYTNIKNGFPFIATKDVGYNNDELDYANGVIIPFESEKFKIAHEHAVLICSEGGSAGKKIGIANRNICFGNKLYANELFNGIYPRYISYIYQSLGFFSLFRDRMTGIIGGIAINEFLTIPVPLPSQIEQVRIVKKIDELMVLCDQLETQYNDASEAHEKLFTHFLDTLTYSKNANDFSENWDRIAAHFNVLFTTEKSLDGLKKIIFQLAVMGKLVPQNPDEESASELLERIRVKKNKLICAGKVKKQKLLSEITDEEKPFALPNGWEWVHLHDLLDPMREISYGVIKLGNEPKTGGVFILRCSDVKPGFIDLSGIRRVSEEIESEYIRTRLQGGEILLNIRGTLGGVSLVEKNLKNYNVAREVAVIPISDIFSGKYLVNVMLSEYFWSAIQESLRGIAYKGLNLGALRLFPIPLPPISEQYRIVDKIDELMSICDQLRSRIAYSNQLQKKIADVIVNQTV